MLANQAGYGLGVRNENTFHTLCLQSPLMVSVLSIEIYDYHITRVLPHLYVIQIQESVDLSLSNDGAYIILMFFSPIQRFSDINYGYSARFSWTLVLALS